MPVFAYRGLSAEGRTVSGVLDADSARSARGKLRASGIFPTEILEESAGARSGSWREWLAKFEGGKMSSTDLALFSRQLAALLGAGVQLVDALGTLGEQARKPGVRRMLSQVRERVREGSSLADALSAHREVFSDLYVGMVRAGETAAALEPILGRLAEYGERQSEFVSKVRGALTYPIIMMCVGAAILCFLVAYVVPQVALIFQQSHAALPLPTRILISLSGFLTSYWIEILIAFAATVLGVAAVFRNPRGRRLYDRMVLSLPFLGETMVRIICARFARTLSTLLASGVQLLPALDAVKGVVTNTLLREAIEQSRESIREGHGMGQTLGRSGLFPPLLVEMVKVGERSGEIEQMLDRVAENYEREVSTSLSQVTTVLEPLMTLMMAGAVVFMMLAVLLPIFQLNQLMQ
jgi:general secretion pathway protein F